MAPISDEVYNLKASHVLTLLFLLFGPLGLLASGSQAVDRRIALTAAKVDKGPDLDGSLTDDVWKQAVPFSGFKMVFPNPGAEPTEKTEIRILYDRDNLYLGVYCYDSRPSLISANTMAHDAASDYHESNDDIVKVLLDPFLDKRSAYIFFINARGARSEGLAFGESFSLDWDGIWDAKARIQPDGWSCEIKIPFKTISFKSELRSWGVNVERNIARKQETIRLSGTRKDSFFYNAMEAAPLEGIAGVKQGLGFTFRPYGTISALRDRTIVSDTDWQVNGGFDLYKNFTPNFVGAFSYNTDFAETEVDERQINLTRFPLYFPEKRTFFLEGSEIFNFGTTGGNEGSFIPFFSRRIGLFEGNQVPIRFGTKVYGKLGDTSLAIMDVATKPFADAGLGSQNFVAGRIYQNVLEESKVGLIFTSGSPTGEKNSLLGFDFNYKTSRFRGDRNFSVGGWYAYNWNTIASGHHQGFGLKVDYPNDLWDIVTTYNYYGDALDPGMGFITRPGTQAYSLSLSYQPRPEKNTWVGKLVRQFNYELWLSYYWDLAGNLQTRRIWLAPLNISLESGDHFEFSIQPTRDVLPYDFEIVDGVVLPKGPYNFTSFNLGFNSAGYRFYGIDVECSFGRFYSGTYSNVELNLALRFKGYVTLSLSSEFVRGNLPQGRFAENVYQFKADFFFSPDLGLMNYIQYDDVSKELGLNMRFRWQISPGNVIYLVYTKDWERRWDPMSRFVPLGERGVFKVQLSVRP
jgi:hypothetical protein